MYLAIKMDFALELKGGQSVSNPTFDNKSFFRYDKLLIGFILVISI